MELTREQAKGFRQVEPFLPFDNPTFGNPGFADATHRVLIVRLSPFRDVDRSLPHLFLFHELRRALPDAFIDLAFFPGAAERRWFEENDLAPLFGIQSLRSVDEFDLVLISNAYTLELINLPYLLLRSGIPLFAGERSSSQWPIILLGGSNAAATQAIIREDGDSLVDGIFFGEGEGRVGDLVRLLQQAPDTGRQSTLDRAAQDVQGFWAAGTDRPVIKATCTPQRASLPLAYPILNTPAAHAANLQITYGCPAFCAFCFEGYDRKPYREIPLPDVLATAQRLKYAHGIEELSLYSFNFNTHSDILPMILDLHKLFDRVSFRSQRVDLLATHGILLEAEVAADKHEFTLGIEGISEHQRTWLHKSLSGDEISATVERLLSTTVRRIKLFYILTGHETGEDIAEFRRFVRWLKETRRTRRRKPRVVFSFGLLIRMPFTPLRHDRLMLDEASWKPLIGQAKSACETNGFEFRLAFDWPTYCTTQVLAMGGHWLVAPLIALARKGYCFDTALPGDYWDELSRWMKRSGRWNDVFLGEKGADYPFPLAFVRSSIPPGFLLRQYEEAQSGKDTGYCLGSVERPGRCLGCGACADDAQRQAVTGHRLHEPDPTPYLAELRAVVAHKRQLRPTYALVCLDEWMTGVQAEFLNAFVFRELLARYPEMVDNLLAVRESLFTVRPNDTRFPLMVGETIFALRAWDAEALQSALDTPEKRAGRGLTIAGLPEGFTPGVFERLHLELRLEKQFFPQPRAHLESYLRSAYVPCSLRREDDGYRFDLPRKGLKKRILYGGFFETHGETWTAHLEVGAKFDLRAFLRTFDQEDAARYAQMRVSHITW